MSKPIFGDRLRFWFGVMLGNFGDYCHQKEETSRLLSFVIPCFNAAASLGSTIKSALERRGVTPELIVVDDGSTDNSIGIARTFEPRLRVLTGRNRGVSAARNRGIDETTSEWIVFLDTDDVLVLENLRLRLEAVGPTRADVVVCDWQEYLDRADGKADGGWHPSTARRSKRMLKSAARRISSAAGSTPASTQPFRENWRVPGGARLKSACVHQQQSDLQP